MVDIQGGYGNALGQVGRKEEGQKSLQEALTLARELKNEDQVSSTLGFLGDGLLCRRSFSGQTLLPASFSGRGTKQCSRVNAHE